MSQQKRNPDIDFGFHATIPRMVRTEYGKLTPMQKWLYVCLKDLCGEHGTCYRTIKVLSEETGISTGMLSESIPILHKEGLIHAEKKKRSMGGKEVWHITIVDIWVANGKLHPAKRSLSEQTPEIVHSVNENVQQVNDQGRKRSAGEHKRSLSETEEESSLSSIITEERSSEESTFGANAPAHDLKEKVRQLLDSDPRLKAITTEMVAQAEEDEAPTVKMPAVKPSKHTTTPEPHDDVAQVGPPAGDSFPASSGGPRRSEARQSTIPKRPAYRKPIAIEKPQLTLEGQQVKEWYEEVREGKVRMTDKNVIACNRLAEIDGMTRDNLKDVIELWDGDKWVKEHNISIDLQELEKPDSKFSFERGLLLVRRKHKGKPKQQEQDEDYSDFDRYVGNGKEERAQLLREYEERLANGTLA